MNDSSVYRSVRLIDAAAYGATILSLGLAVAEPSIPTAIATSVTVSVTLYQQHRAHRAGLRALAYLAQHPAAPYEQVRDALDLRGSDTSDALPRLIDARLIDETSSGDRPVFALR